MAHYGSFEISFVKKLIITLHWIELVFEVPRFLYIALRQISCPMI
jgi:hypothetical protein